MNQGQLKKQNKDVLHGICNDLGIAFEADDFKNDLATKIVEREGWSTHALYVAPTGEAVVETEEEEKADGNQPVLDDEDGSELSAEEKKSIALQEECIQREIAMSGEETVEELEALIFEANSANIAAAELNDAKEQADKLGIVYSEDDDDAKSILAAVAKVKADIAEKKSDEEKAKSELHARIAKGVTMEDLQQAAETIGLMCEQMIKQLNSEKKSSDRFHKAVKDLGTMRRDVFIR